MNLKTKIVQQLASELDHKIQAAIAAITSAKESRNNDTKSSAGDKYETGREMMQMEIDKSEHQLHKTVHLKEELARVHLHKENQKVEFGSLVFTNHENYFIAIAAGKVHVEGETYYAISLASPIGMLLKDKIVGQTVQFQGREIKITAIV
jgi:transcription elongation GreA/GreB family factor